MAPNPRLSLASSSVSRSLTTIFSTSGNTTQPTLDGGKDSNINPIFSSPSSANGTTDMKPRMRKLLSMGTSSS